MSGRSVSISGAAVDGLRRYSKSTGIPVRSLAEAILAPDLYGSKPAPDDADARIDWVRERVDEHRARMNGVAFIPRPTPTRRAPIPPATVAIELSRELWDDVDAQMQRRENAGLPPITADEMIELAINRMLDEVETIPPGLICSQCTDDINGVARQLPAEMFKSGATGLVWVCWNCDTLHPRKGNYSFAGGRDIDRRAARGVIAGGHDGNGNHHKRAR